MKLKSSMGWDIYSDMPLQISEKDILPLIHISKDIEVSEVREKVNKFFWPKTGLPTSKLPVVTIAYDGLGNLPPELNGILVDQVTRVEKLDVLVDNGYHLFSFMVYPKNSSSATRLAIIHQGHQDGLVGGISDLANHLLSKGFQVLLMHMPFFGWNKEKTFVTSNGTITVSGHDQLVSALDGPNGSSLRFFIEPVIVGVNYFIKLNPKHKGIAMIGLSGGGWTTTLAPAMDSRIDLSIPVAGSYPLILRPIYPGSTGDAEQLLPALYKDRASYLDLYILGSYGKGRSQIQLLNQYDTCCFYGVGSNTYKEIVKQAVVKLGVGSWNCVIDSTHKTHQISPWAIKEIIAPAVEALNKIE